MLVGLLLHLGSSFVQHTLHKLNCLLHACNLVRNRCNRTISHLAHSMFQGQHWFATIHNVCRYEARCSTFGGVKCELREWQCRIPATLACSDQTAKNLLNASVEPLSLPICLRMMSRGHVQLHPQSTSQCFPETRSETWIAI